MAVIPIPVSKLPPDAHFTGRPQMVMVYPHNEGWTTYVADTDGGCRLAEGVSKAEAMGRAVEVVLATNAELTLRNRWERL